MRTVRRHAREVRVGVRALLALLGGAALSACAGRAAATRPPATDEKGRALPVALAAGLPAGWPAPSPVDEIVVKTYPAARGAFVTQRTKPDKALNAAFFPLFGHITASGIPMTAPVVADYAGADDGSIDVAFLYPTATEGSTGRGMLAEVKDVPASTVVSIGVRGPYDVETLRSAVAQLGAWLEAHADLEAAGAPRRLFYEQPKGDRSRLYSEVQIPVRRRLGTSVPAPVPVLPPSPPPPATPMAR